MTYTRYEIIRGHRYCAYCGKKFEEQDVCLTSYPAQHETWITPCTCKGATEERELYKKLQELYNRPVSEKIIELKVNAYRDMLVLNNSHSRYNGMRDAGIYSDYTSINGRITGSNNSAIPSPYHNSKTIVGNCSIDDDVYASSQTACDTIVDGFIKSTDECKASSENLLYEA